MKFAIEDGVRPRLSLALPVHGVPFAHTLAVARAAEAAGFDGLWVPDHLINLSRPNAGVLECWTVLAAVAAATTRVQVGPLVIATPLRHAPLLAKQVATLADLIPSRLTLGLGTGGFTYEAACAAMGIAPLTAGERVAHVEETIRTLRTSVQVPIVIGAERPRMLQLTAKVAHGWNCPRPERLEAGLRALARAGRDRATLQVSAYVVTVIVANGASASAALARAGRSAHAFGDVTKHHIVGDPTRVRERIAHFVGRGADEVVLDLRGTPHLEAIDLIAREVLPHMNLAASTQSRRDAEKQGTQFNS